MRIRPFRVCARFAALLAACSLAAAQSDNLAARVSQLNSRARAAVMDASRRPGGALSLDGPTRQIFTDRLSLLRRLAAEDPRRAASLLLSEAETDGLRAVGAPVEEPYSYRGAAIAGVMDFFDERRAVSFYEIRDPQAGRLMAFIADDGAAPADGTIEVSGWRIGDTALLTSVAQVSATQCAPAGEQRVALLLVYPPDVARPASTAEQFTEAFFGEGDATLSRFYDRASLGKLKVTGQAYGWYQLPKQYECNSLTPMRDDAIKAADGDVDFSNVDRLHFIMHSRITTSSCTFGGVSYGGCPAITTTEGANTASASYTVAGTNPSPTSRHTPTHELGHNFGMGHARTLKFPGESLAADRTHAIYDEYGDPISIMGGGNSFPAASHKARLTWLTAGDYTQVESSGAFTLRPLQATDGARALKIRRWPGKDEWIWLEYRHPGDEWTQWSDPRATGAVLHLETPTTSSYTDLLLGTPPAGPLTDGDDWELRRGAVWRDLHGPVTIELGKSTPEGMEVQVRYEDSCVTVDIPPGGVVLRDQPVTLPVTAPRGCIWAAKPDELWMTVTRNDGSITIMPAAMPQLPRTGSVTVGRTVVPVKQLGLIAGSQIYRATPDRGGINAQRALHADLTMLQIPGNDIRQIEISYGPQPGADNSCWLVYDVATRTMWNATDTASSRAVPAAGAKAMPSCTISALAYSGGTTTSEAAISYSFKWTGASLDALLFSARFSNRDGTKTEWAQAASYSVTTSCWFYPSNGRLKVSGDNNTVSLTIDTDPGCEWAAATTADWLTLANETAAGPAVLRITSARNTSYLPRAAVISVGDRSVEVWQPAGPATATTVTMLPGELLVGAGESTQVVRAQDSPHLAALDITSNTSWIQVKGVRMTTVNGNIPATWWTTLHVDANPAPEPRRGSVTFGPLTYDVVQNGCASAELSPATQVVGPDAAAGIIQVNVFTAGTWTAASDSGWLAFDDGGTGAGSGALRFRVAPNHDAASRTAVVTVGASMVTVTQAAAGSTVETAYIARPFAGILPEEGVDAGAARFDRPGGIAQDSKGNFYVAEHTRRAVFRIAPDGKVSRAAGNGLCCNSGDGGDAPLASLNNPDALAVDSQDRLYISDRGSCVVRRVETDGTIGTVAGTGICGYDGDDKPATQARISQIGIAIAPDDALLIADAGNHRIRRVDAAGRIGAIAGTGSAKSAGDGGPAVEASLYSPESLTVDRANNLYIAEAGGNRIRRIAPDGTITTIAGTGIGSSTGDGGPAASAGVYHPTDVRVDAAGNLIVAELYSNRIRRIQPDGTIATILGDGRMSQTGDGGPAKSATAAYPIRLHLDASGNLYFTENYATGVRRIDAGSNVSRFAGMPDTGGFGGAARQVKLVDPRAIAVSPAGDVYIADGDGRRVHRITPDGMHSLLAGNGGYGTTTGTNAANVSFQRPWGLGLMPNGEVLIVDMWQNRVLGVKPAGETRIVAGSGTAGYTGDGGPAVSARLNSPRAVAVDGSGNIFLADYSNCVIRRIDTTGTITTVAGNGKCAVTPDGSPASASLYYPETVAITADGAPIWSEGSTRMLRYLDADGKFRSILDSLSLAFNGNSVSAAGTAGLVFTDSGSRVVRRYAADAGVLRMAASTYSQLIPDSDIPADWLMLRDATAVASGPGGVYYVLDARAGRVYQLVPAW